MTQERPASLVDVFRRSARLHPARVALAAEGESLTYADVLAAASRLAHGLDERLEPGAQLCGVLGAETPATFSGILGTLLGARGYVPLNPGFPPARTLSMIDRAELPALVVDRAGRESLAEILERSNRRLALLFPDADPEETASWRRRFAGHDFAGDEDLPERGECAFRPPDPEDIAYLMFTSGSTGRPKGVMITHRNILGLLDAVDALFDFGPDDRFSQMFDLTFDLSLYDMFVCWGAGAELHVVPKRDRMAPAAFIRRAGLTAWFSVPAVAGFMHQLNMLQPDSFPSLRVSAFCGEPLPAKVAEQWQLAAPGSRVENLYGPTELTVACTSYRWRSDSSPEACLNGVVPIGRSFRRLETALVDEALNPVAAGEAGELCVRGRQTSPGYWRDEQLTGERFVAMPWSDREDNRWYRTGDLARLDEAGDLLFAGRVDQQVQVLGYRVELLEVEAALREHAGTQFVAAIAWPPGETAASGIVACLAETAAPDEEILEGCRAALPEYMVPQRIYRYDRLPLNPNGKIDRKALTEQLRRESTSS